MDRRSNGGFAGSTVCVGVAPGNSDATVSVVEQNLTVIDQAVDEARRALADDPANADLSGYLLETRRRKLDLLRHAAALSESTVLALPATLQFRSPGT